MATASSPAEAPKLRALLLFYPQINRTDDAYKVLSAAGHRFGQELKALFIAGVRLDLKTLDYSPQRACYLAEASVTKASAGYLKGIEESGTLLSLFNRPEVMARDDPLAGCFARVHVEFLTTTQEEALRAELAATKQELAATKQELAAAKQEIAALNARLTALEKLVAAK